MTNGEKMAEDVPLPGDEKAAAVRELEGGLALVESEERYRRLFESAKDGILLLDFETGRITGVNPFMSELLGYSKEDFIGKHLWEVGPFKDISSAKDDFQELKTRGYIRYSDMPLETKDGRKAPVEFVSNVYEAGGRKVIQCNIRDISGRKTAEAARAESEAKYRTLFDQAHDSILLLELPEEGEPVIVDVNAETLRMYGYSREELLGKPVSILNENPDSSRLIMERKRALTGAGGMSFEVRHKRRDGSVFTAEASGQDILIGGKRLALLVERDITGRKLAEGALMVKTMLLEAQSEASIDGILAVDNESHVLLVNKRFGELWDISSQVLETKDDKKILAQALSRLKDPAEFRSKVEYLYGHKAEKCRDEVEFADGRWIDRYSAPLTDPDGKYHGRIWYFRDITERKKAETDIREAYEMERKLNAIRQHSLTSLPLRQKLAAQLATLFSIPWLAVEPKGAVFLISGRTLTLAAQQGLSTALLTACAKLPFGKCLCGRAAESGAVVVSKGIGPEHEIGYEGMHEHGHYCAPISASGATLGVLNLYTKEKTAFSGKQKDFIKSVSDIIASDILRARAEEQVAQSQKLEAIGQMAGGIAHDLNNILTAILGYANFIGAAIPAGDPKREDLDEILKAGERAAVLTRQLLTFSRKQVVQFSGLNLDQVILETIKMLRRMIPEDVELRTMLKSAPAAVLANQGQVAQLIMNLALNARDAMPDGGKLTFETVRREVDKDYAATHAGVPPGRYVMMTVSDTGSGMSAEVTAHLFEPFFTTKEKGKGTGLGLSTVYGIVKQSGGNIFVYSEPGKGTTFKIYLPLAAEKVEEKPAETPPLSAYHGTETILLVEDEEAVMKFVSRLLTQNGYSILEAATPREAIELCEGRQDVQLMITDVVMPQMNGYVLAKTIKALVPPIKVIFMSGYIDNALTRENLMQPGVALLEKPLKADALLSKVREVLESRP